MEDKERQVTEIAKLFELIDPKGDVTVAMDYIELLFDHNMLWHFDDPVDEVFPNLPANLLKILEANRDELFSSELAKSWGRFDDPFGYALHFCNRPDWIGMDYSFPVDFLEVELAKGINDIHYKLMKEAGIMSGDLDPFQQMELDRIIDQLTEWTSTFFQGNHPESPLAKSLDEDADD